MKVIMFICKIRELFFIMWKKIYIVIYIFICIYIDRQYNGAKGKVVIIDF